MLLDKWNEPSHDEELIFQCARELSFDNFAAIPAPTARATASCAARETCGHRFGKLNAVFFNSL